MKVPGVIGDLLSPVFRRTLGEGARRSDVKLQGGVRDHELRRDDDLAGPLECPQLNDHQRYRLSQGLEGESVAPGGALGHQHGDMSLLWMLGLVSRPIVEDPEAVRRVHLAQLDLHTEPLVAVDREDVEAAATAGAEFLSSDRDVLAKTEASWVLHEPTV
jgi:hypothetical protein